MISSIGSYISFFGIIIFLYIIWESLIQQRIIINPAHINSSIEWFQNTPPSEHSYSELPILTNLKIYKL